MTRMPPATPTLTTIAKLSILLLACAAVPAHAGPTSQRNEILSCQTVNGRTTCFEGHGSMACTSIDGNTTCSGDATLVDPIPELGGSFDFGPNPDIFIDPDTGHLRVHAPPSRLQADR